MDIHNPKEVNNHMKVITSLPSSILYFTALFIVILAVFPFIMVHNITPEEFIDDSYLYTGTCIVSLFLMTASYLYLIKLLLHHNREREIAEIKFNEYCIGLKHDREFREHRKEMEQVQANLKTEEWAWKTASEILKKQENSVPGDKIQMAISTVQDLISVKNQVIKIIRDSEKQNNTQPQ